MKRTTIEINGVLYDSASGMPMGGESDRQSVDGFAPKRASRSHDVHHRMQRSQTLNRHAVKKHAPVGPTERRIVSRSPMVTKFAKHQVKTVPETQVTRDIGPSVHPLVQKTQNRLDAVSAQPQSVLRPAALIKKQAMEAALEAAPSHHAYHPVRISERTPRAFSLISATIAVLVLGGIFMYSNLPNLSVRVASAQAGIDASFPSYRPDGYRLEDITYSEGSVGITFAANAGPQRFTLTQQQTSWDSSAVKEKYIKPNWGDNVVPYVERGLTIFANNSNAVWVNKGILYTISGDAPLSASQLRAVATNL